MNGVDYYQLFSLSPDAGVDELRAQYRKLSLTHHPDRGGSTEQMAQLNEAYRVLSNPLLRREYDQRHAVGAYVSDDNTYHYTRPPARPAYAHAATAQSQSHFWRWFVVLAVLGTALVAYDIMATWVMPRYLTQSPIDSSSATLTPSGDLTDEAASAISEFQGVPSTHAQDTPQFQRGRHAQ